MTILIGMNLGEVGIVAADKKEVAIFDETIIPIHEEAKKIINTGIGVMTGSGFVSLLQEVKETVSNAKITNTDQILSIIMDARGCIKNNLSINASQKAALLNKTGWLFSYCTVVDSANKLRLGIYHPSLSESNIAIVGEGTAKIIFPSDIEPRITSQLTSFISSEMKIPESKNLNEVLSHNINIVLSIIKEVSMQSETVSESCDVSLVFSSGDMLIANSVSLSEPELNFVPLHS